MALANTENAIGAVSRLLREQLGAKSGADVSVGRPESGGGGGISLNLFLYEASFDASMRHVSLYEGQATPLWLVLKYLLTAFNGSESDSVEAHEVLGKGARALQAMSYLSLNKEEIDEDVFNALSDNPEVLKITFDEVSPDLLSKIMQGSDEKYRVSLGFQVRPVMIASGELPSHPSLVGVNYKAPLPERFIGDEGVHIDTLPAQTPILSAVHPVKFESGSTLTIRGTHLNLSGLSVRLGPATLPVSAQHPDELTCEIDQVYAGGHTLSAGGHPISVAQALSGGRNRVSNLLVGYMLPTLGAVEEVVVTELVSSADPEINFVRGKIKIRGAHLGTDEDDIFVSFCQNGKVIKVLENPALRSEGAQTVLNINIEPEYDEVVAGIYRLVLHVNGQQARNSPEVELI